MRVGFYKKNQNPQGEKGEKIKIDFENPKTFKSSLY